MENQDQQPIEEVVQEATEELVQSEEQPEVKAEERPEINYKMEIERRKAEADRLRAELEAEKAKQTNRRDQNDISTWSDTELHAIKNSNDPAVLPYKQQADDLLFERKMAKVLERERQSQKRVTTEMELRTKYPEALDSASEFALKMEQVMFDLDLQKSPAGRLAAARIVAAEGQKGTVQPKAAGRNKEEARLKDVKQTLSEGDRPDPRASSQKPVKQEDLTNIINDKRASHESQSHAMAELLRQRGISRDSFFKK